MMFLLGLTLTWTYLSFFLFSLLESYQSHQFLLWLTLNDLLQIVDFYLGKSREGVNRLPHYQDVRGSRISPQSSLQYSQGSYQQT